jgi:hypothetical protein
MQVRQVRKLISSSRAMASLYCDAGRARLMSSVASKTRGARRKVLLTLIGAALVGLLILVSHPVIAALLAPLALGPAVARLVRRLRLEQRLRGLARADRPLDGLPPARQTLLDLGLDPRTVDRIVSDSAEVRIATFDQESRVLSDVGPIPFFEGVEVTPEEFRERESHRLELVVVRGVVCVKKTYGDRSRFANELLALDALAGIPEVPRIVAVRLRPPILYQSFILGPNLGSLMARHGASIVVQYEVSVAFAGGDPRNPAIVHPARDTALTALAASVPPGVVTRLGRLLERIHQRRVTVSDVKYGNVLLVGDRPCLCDFDSAKVFRRNDRSCARERQVDRDRFNYFFGGNLLSEPAFQAAVARLARKKKDLLSGWIYYGRGYSSPGEGSLKRGSGEWHRLRPFLPDLEGKSVLDLGSNNPALPLEMLREGACRVTAFVPDPTVARYARLNHRWLEFVDNRRYPGFRLINGFHQGHWDRDWSGYDIATALSGLPCEEPPLVAQAVRALSRTIDWLVVRADQADDGHSGGRRQGWPLEPLRELLRTNGYPDQRVFHPAFDRPLLIGRRSKG